MSIKDFYRAFPDYPNIKRDSIIYEIDLSFKFHLLTKEQRNDIIEEMVGLQIIEPCKNNGFIITSKGWEMWNNHF